MQSTARTEESRDLLMSPNTYAYLQNEGKGGLISIHVGPTVINKTGQDKAIYFDTTDKRFKPSDNLESVVRAFPRAKEDEYLILENPAKNGKFPDQKVQQAEDLEEGLRIVIPGPWTHALWPGQIAQVVEGHRLRSNQYLIASIYNEKAAKENWKKAVVKVQTQTEKTEKTEETPTTSREIRQREEAGLPEPKSYAVGTRIIIKGGDISFFIPPTGVEVLCEDKDGKPTYVREAVTLEQSEYCVLVDENGSKKFPKGPAVVFPEPTQIFQKDREGRRKFRPLELNTINGVHLKVTCSFSGEDLEKPLGENGKRPMRNYKEGEELFVTGREVAIYYPQEEFSIIEYGKNNTKHFSTAIPKGEGRYVINRESGEIKTVEGPMMLLPDPRKEIIVRRILSPRTCALLYPGNEEALLYNKSLSEAATTQPSGRSGFLSEGDATKVRGAATSNMENVEVSTSRPQFLAAAYTYDQPYNPEQTGTTLSPTVGRGTGYTEPRRLTLNTKFDGVPKIELWPGYAILIVGAGGRRRVEVGPKTILLDYDEEPGFMTLSMGKPKSTDKLIQTGYLIVQNNQVTDIVNFESSDHVTGKVKLSYRVNFEGSTPQERERWFSVDNYVKYLCDRVRSIIAGMGKRYTIRQIKMDYINLVRDAILGQKPPEPATAEGRPSSAPAKRPGYKFPDNLMHLFEVEVLELTLNDKEISALLEKAQLSVVKGDIELEETRKQHELTKASEELKRQTALVRFETQHQDRDIQRRTHEENTALTLLQIASEVKRLAELQTQEEQTQQTYNYKNGEELARAKTKADLDLEISEAKQKLEVALIEAHGLDAVKRFAAAKDGFGEILVSLSREEIATKIAEATNFERVITNGSMESALAHVFSIAPSLKAIWDRADASVKAQAKNRLAAGTATAAQRPGDRS